MNPETENLDAKLTEESSTSVQATAESQDAKSGAESSAAQTQDAKQQSPEDLIEAAATKGEEQSTDSSTEETTAEANAEQEAEQAEDSASNKDEKEVPFHEHPRWKEKIQEVETLKQQVEQSNQRLERMTQLEQFVTANNITEDQFREVMELAAALNNNPARAWEIIEPKVSVLSQFNANVLPEDLAKEVEDGILSKERAQEIAKFRASEKANAGREKVSVEQQQRAALQAIDKAALDWDTAQQKLDPTFKPKASANEPDGKWEFVQMAFYNKLRSTKDFSPAGIVRLLEESKQGVEKSFGRLTPAKKPMRTLSANGTSAKTKPELKTADDIIEAAARGETVR